MEWYGELGNSRDPRAGVRGALGVSTGMCLNLARRHTIMPGTETSGSPRVVYLGSSGVDLKECRF